MNLEIPKGMINANAHCHLNTEMLTNKLVVGLMGYRRSGKDSIAKELVSTYGYKRIALGDSLKREINQYAKEIVYEDLRSKDINLGFDQIDFLSEDDSIKEILRPYMIYYGQSLRRINGSFTWTNKAFEEIRESDKVVISDLRREEELAIFRDSIFTKNRQAEHLIYAGILDTEEEVQFNQTYESILFHVNQFGLEDDDELTAKAIRKGQEEWLFADTFYIDSRIPDNKRENYIKTQVFLMHSKYIL